MRAFIFRPAVFLAILALNFAAACGGGNEPPSANQIARDTVKAVINPVVARQFPGVPTDIVVDCVIDNATASEIVSIANSALLGNTTDSLYVILPIVQRPNTLQCVTAKALGA